mmetsp:Transcript_26322/g.83345  ORF Transcript_26322/g.83345 Transcript_26322/m.83345 type:complete len:258 (-) Transcript_26322:545-1318(-)
MSRMKAARPLRVDGYEKLLLRRAANSVSNAARISLARAWLFSFVTPGCFALNFIRWSRNFLESHALLSAAPAACSKTSVRAGDHMSLEVTSNGMMSKPTDASRSVRNVANGLDPAQALNSDNGAMLPRRLRPTFQSPLFIGTKSIPLTCFCDNFSGCTKLPPIQIVRLTCFARMSFLAATMLVNGPRTRRSQSFAPHSRLRRCSRKAAGSPSLSRLGKLSFGSRRMNSPRPPMPSLPWMCSALPRPPGGWYLPSVSL